MPVREYTDQQIIDRLPICDGWKGLPDGILDVWVRSDEDEFDRFDDKVYTYDCSSGVAKFKGVCSGTSNAGAEGLKHYDKYNREGCAILKGNQIVYNSHAHGLHKGKYPAYRQVKPFPYYRGGNKNNKAEEIGPVHNDIIGANCHKAGMYSTYIGGWSVACLVRNRQAAYDAWMKFMDHRPLSVAILEEWDPDSRVSVTFADEDLLDFGQKDPAVDLFNDEPASDEPADADLLPRETAIDDTPSKPTGPAQPPPTDGFTPAKFTAFVPQIDTAKRWIKAIGTGGTIGTAASVAAGLPLWIQIAFASLVMVVVIGTVVMFIKYHNEIFAYITAMNTLRADSSMHDPEISAETPKG